MKFLPWGWGSSGMPHDFTHNLFQAFPDKKYVKISIFREISASKVSNVYRNNRDYMYPPPKDQALGQVDMWSGFWSC